MEEFTVLSEIEKFLEDEESPTAVEYAIMVAGIAVAIITGVYALGHAVQNSFSTSATSVK